MSDTQAVTFRSPETPTEAPVQTAANKESSKTTTQLRTGTSVDDSSPTPYVYGELEKKPYSVKYLGLELYNDDADFADVQEQAKALDQYVIKQAKAQGLKDSHDSYKEVVEAIYKQIGKSPNEDPVKSLKRLSVAAGALERLQSAKMQPILSAQTLSAEEFEEVQA